MNKQAIIDQVHEAIGGTKAQAEKAMDVILDAIVSTLKKGDEVNSDTTARFIIKVWQAGKIIV